MFTQQLIVIGAHQFQLLLDLFSGNTDGAQDACAKAQAGLNRLRDGFRRAQTFQALAIAQIPGPGIYRQIRPALAQHGHQNLRRLMLVQRDHRRLGLADPGRGQDMGVTRIAVINRQLAFPPLCHQSAVQFQRHIGDMHFRQ